MVLTSLALLCFFGQFGSTDVKATTLESLQVSDVFVGVFGVDIYAFNIQGSILALGQGEFNPSFDLLKR